MGQPEWKELRWDEAVDRVGNVVFRITAGSSGGTAFVVGLGHDKEQAQSYACLATAWHVVSDLPGTSADIQMVSADKKKVLSSDRHQMGFHPLGKAGYDTALIVVNTGHALLEEAELAPLFPFESVLARGADVGWLGFPGLAQGELCFFHGFISGYLNDPPTYLVDGVAVNGVSGGPAFDNRAHLIGMVSSYLPNRVDKQTTLPGLLAVTPINAIRYWMEHIIRARVLGKKDIDRDST